MLLRSWKGLGPRKFLGGLPRFLSSSLEFLLWASSPTPQKAPRIWSESGKGTGPQAGQRQKGARVSSLLQNEGVALFLAASGHFQTFPLLGREQKQSNAIRAFGAGLEGTSGKLCQPAGPHSAGSQEETKPRPDGREPGRPVVLERRAPSASRPPRRLLLPARELSLSWVPQGSVAPQSPEALRALERRGAGGEVGVRRALGSAGKAGAPHQPS